MPGFILLKVLDIQEPGVATTAISFCSSLLAKLTESELLIFCHM